MYSRHVCRSETVTETSLSLLESLEAGISCVWQTNECGKGVISSLWWIPSFYLFPLLLFQLIPSQFRRCLLQLLCSRLSWLQRSLKERPLAPVERPIRPIVMSRPCSSRDRPKKKVTFSSSSIVFIITSNDFHHLDVTSKAGDSTEVNVIQVRPLWSTRTFTSRPTTQYALGPNLQFQAKIILSDLSGHFCVHTQLQTFWD